MWMDVVGTPSSFLSFVHLDNSFSYLCCYMLSLSGNLLIFVSEIDAMIIIPRGSEEFGVTT